MSEVPLYTDAALEAPVHEPLLAVSLSSEIGTYMTAKARFWA